jgi:hypothetical protein
MPFHHEKLTVYQRALEFASWSQDLIESLAKRTSTRDHLERAGDSVALNIAEGNSKFSRKIAPAFWKSPTIRPWNRLHVLISLWRDTAVQPKRLLRAKQFCKKS